MPNVQQQCEHDLLAFQIDQINGIYDCRQYHVGWLVYTMIPRCTDSLTAARTDDDAGTCQSAQTPWECDGYSFSQSYVMLPDMT